MKIAFVIFNGMTSLDLIGIYDPLTRLKTMGFTKVVTLRESTVTPTIYFSRS